MSDNDPHAGTGNAGPVRGAHDAHQNDEHQNDAHQNDEHQNDEHQNDEHRNDEHRNDEHQNDGRPNDGRPNDGRPNDDRPRGAVNIDSPAKLRFLNNLIRRFKTLKNTGNSCKGQCTDLLNETFNYEDWIIWGAEGMIDVLESRRRARPQRPAERRRSSGPRRTSRRRTAARRTSDSEESDSSDDDGQGQVTRRDRDARHAAVTRGRTARNSGVVHAQVDALAAEQPDQQDTSRPAAAAPAAPAAPEQPSAAGAPGQVNAAPPEQPGPSAPEQPGPHDEGHRDVMDDDIGGDAPGEETSRPVAPEQPSAAGAPGQVNAVPPEQPGPSAPEQPGPDDGGQRDVMDDDGIGGDAPGEETSRPVEPGTSIQAGTPGQVNAAPPEQPGPSAPEQPGPDDEGQWDVMDDDIGGDAPDEETSRPVEHTDASGPVRAPRRTSASAQTSSAGQVHDPRARHNSREPDAARSHVHGHNAPPHSERPAAPGRHGRSQRDDLDRGAPAETQASSSGSTEEFRAPVFSDPPAAGEEQIITDANRIQELRDAIEWAGPMQYVGEVFEFIRTLESVLNAPNADRYAFRLHAQYQNDYLMLPDRMRTAVDPLIASFREAIEESSVTARQIYDLAVALETIIATTRHNFRRPSRI